MSEESEFEIRKILSFSDETRLVLSSKDSEGLLRKVAVAAVVKNPFAGEGIVVDLSPLVHASGRLGAMLGELAARELDQPVESYGKAGIVGSAGEQEHINASLTSVFGNAVRDAVGGGDAWISSTEKLGGPGTLIDVPLASKDDVWVRSHYDTHTLYFSDAPLPDEIVIIFAVANRGRLNARVGGRTLAEALALKSSQR